jgi:methionyl-tRNA formyltransferase
VGRGQRISKSAVKNYCISNRIKFLQPLHLNNKDFINELKGFNADIFIVVAFKILPENIWTIPKKGTINIHASILPNLRGAAPINWAIIYGLKKTGLTSFFINNGIDTGDIIIQDEIDINENDTYEIIYQKLKKLSSTFILESIKAIEGGLEPKIQSKIKSEFLKAPKLDKKNTRIKWNDTGNNIKNLIKGLSPYPGAWSIIKSNGIRVKIIDSEFIPKPISTNTNGLLLQNKKDCMIQVKNGVINVLKIKIEGKKEQSGRDFVNGNQGKKILFI